MNTAIHINNIQAILNDCTYLEPSSLDYEQHPIITHFGSPNHAIYVHDDFSLDDGTALENALVLKQENAITLINEKDIVSYKMANDGQLERSYLSYVYMGDKPNIDAEIYMSYNVEQFFSLLRCGLTAVLVLSSSSKYHELTSAIIKNIERAVEQLQKQGYYRLYLPLALHDTDKMMKIDGVQVLPLTVPNGHGGHYYTELSQHDDVEQMTGVLELAKQQYKTPYLCPSFAWENGTFKVTKDGVYFVEHNKDGDTHSMLISSLVIVKAKTRDETGHNWGRLLEWVDDDGRTHQQAIPNELFQTDGADLRMMLANAGVTINPSTKARRLFSCYLMKAPTPQLALCVERVGWYGSQYILPHKVYGQKDEILVYQGSNQVAHAYHSKGVLADWQKHIAQPCEQHNKLVFAICTALAGALLEPMGLKGQGFHFKGVSSKGKSTALNVACSVWGNAHDFMRTWRATGNALEYTAFLHNDGFLALDEIGQINKPKELGEIAYMLCNGQGKARMTKAITNRPLKVWRLIVLSSGEKSLKEIMSEVGQQAQLGQEIRLIDIDVDNSPYGIFDSVDFKDTASLQAEYLNQHSKQYYGIAGETWLSYLCDNFDDVMTQAKQLYQQYKQQLEQNIDDGHIKRVAGQFALIAVAGELAKSITSWQTGRAMTAVQSIFNDWFSQFEYKGDYQQKQILRQVRAFLSVHGSSRFEPSTGGGDDRINNRAGYYKEDNGGKFLLVFPSVFDDEMCKGLNKKMVIQTLIEHEWLIPSGSRPNKLHRVHDYDKPIRLYEFSPKAMSDDLEL